MEHINTQTMISFEARGDMETETETETAECRGRRLLGIVENTILNNRTKVSYSAILWDFYSFYKAVLLKEPDKYLKDCIMDIARRPYPMGPYDGIGFFNKEHPVPDEIFLAFLDEKNTKSPKRKN